MTRKLQKSLTEQKRKTEQVNQQIPGLLGLPLDGQRRVEVPNRNAFVFVRLRNNQSEVIQAYNNQVAPAYNLPVLVERNGGRYEVIGVDTASYENNWNSSAPFLPRHGNTHSFDPETGGGGDIVWVHTRQFMPALVLPSGSVGAANLIVSPYTLMNSDGTWKYVGNTGTANIAQHRPSSSTGAIMGLVYLDAPSGNPYLIINSGTIFSNSITGSSQVYPYIPTVTSPATQIPLVAVRLITGTSRLSWDNIYDVRQFIHTTPSGSAGGGGGGGIDTIGIAGQDEGVNVGTGTVLNVTGAGATLTRSGSVLNLDVSGGGSSILGVLVQDEGVPLGTGTTLNFVGAGIDATISGSVARIHVSGSSLLDGPQGFGYSYQIVASEAFASGTVTISLKTQAGATPSSSNKLIFRIGDTRRELMSACEVTLTTGTNWMNAGGSELANETIDFFVYAIWETAASAVRVGVSRIPYAKEMADFENTTTDEKYIKGNYSAFDANDLVENIGRVALSKSSTNGAWFVIEEEISHPIYFTNWRDWNPVIVGFSANPTLICRYKLIDNLLHLSQDTTAVGTSNATSFTETAPFKAVNISSYFQYSAMPYVRNNGTLEAAGIVYASPNSNVLTLNRSAFGTWTASGNKTAAYNIAVEI